MTYKEALESLKFEVYEEGHCSYIEEELDFAIKALEKQIPKKPKKINADYINGRWFAEYKCSVCGNPSTDGSYCSCCGQALDWSDTE